MIIGVPKEIKLQEHRIGLTPDSVKALTDKKHEVLVQENGGFEAGFTNKDYLAAGAKIIKTPEEIFKSAELAYKTYGKLNKNASNVIVLPTFYTGNHLRNEGFIGKSRAINPNKYFIISINIYI